MAALTFDAVVYGGGNKALMLAIYLAKYGGMSVGIFERRHEVGRGLAKAQEEKLGVKMKKLPQDPQIAGAVGAALIARERLSDGSQAASTVRQASS